MKICKDISVICPLIAAPLQRELTEQFVLQILKYYTGYEDSLLKSKSGIIVTAIKHMFSGDQ